MSFSVSLCPSLSVGSRGADRCISTPTDQSVAVKSNWAQTSTLWRSSMVPTQGSIPLSFPCTRMPDSENFGSRAIPSHGTSPWNLVCSSRRTVSISYENWVGQGHICDGMQIAISSASSIVEQPTCSPFDATQRYLNSQRSSWRSGIWQSAIRYGMVPRRSSRGELSRSWVRTASVWIPDQARSLTTPGSCLRVDSGIGRPTATLRMCCRACRRSIDGSVH
jgi:hypothetical protein